MKKAAKSDDLLMKECAFQDLQQLHDPKNESVLFQWFKEMVDKTGEELEKQERISQEY